MIVVIRLFNFYRRGGMPARAAFFYALDTVRRDRSFNLPRKP